MALEFSETAMQQSHANQYGPVLYHPPNTTKDVPQLERMVNNINQQAMTTWKPPNAMARPGSKQVNFAMLVPVLEQQLDNDKATQLNRLYARLRSNNINKEDFVRRLGSLVGDHMLKTTVFKLQQGQLTAKPSMDCNAQKQRLLEQQLDSHGVHASHNSSNVNVINQERDQPFQMQGLGKQHMPFPQPSFPNHGSYACNYSSSNMNMSSQPLKQIMQGPVQTAVRDMERLPQSSGNWQLSIHKDQSLVSSVAYAEQQPLDQINDQQHKSQLSAPHDPSSTSVDEPESMPIAERLSFLIQSAGSNGKTFPNTATVGQKKPLETPVSSLSKKQKVSGAFSDQQLNDVTAFSELNVRLEKLQEELEKEREARQNIEARLKKIEHEREQERAEREREREQERAERERERKQERIEREREREQERIEHERQREQELAKCERKREEDLAAREQELSELTKWRKNMEEMLKKCLYK